MPFWSGEEDNILNTSGNNPFNTPRQYYYHGGYEEVRETSHFKEIQ